MNIGFERIMPTPLLPAGVTTAALNAYAWTSGANIVTQFKGSIKQALRIAQLGRCCFCRRHLGADIDTDLEHFVDAEVFQEFRFEIRNLALSCAICNTKKNGMFNSWRAKMKRRHRAVVGPRPRICPVINTTIHIGDPFPTTPMQFRWVNPHLHNYSDHIAVERSWVFKGKTPIGRRTVRGLNLNDLGSIERRALYETLEMRGGRLSMLVCAIGELEHHRAYEVGFALAKAIKRRRQASAAAP
jgi:hypothetical protein